MDMADNSFHRFRAISIFSDRREMALILPPLAILLLIFLSWFQVWTFNDSDRMQLLFLINVAFINSFHIIFTFQLALAVPVYRERLLANEGKIGGLAFLIGVAIFVLALRGAEILGAEPVQSMAELIVVIYAAYHVMRQSFGLSLIYNILSKKNKLLTPDQLAKLNQAERLERIFNRCLISMVALHLTFRMYLDQTHQTFPAVINWIYTVLVFLSFITLAVVYGRISFQTFKIKILFLSRLSIIALSAFSFVAILGVSIIHGLEYYLIYRRIYPHSQRVPTSVSRMRHLFTYLIAAVIIIATIVHPALGFPTSHYATQLAFVIAGSFGLFHYYVDGVIFAMRNPSIREQTGHWLLEDSMPE